MTADLAVVGAGIVGLAHALAAARAGWRVVVIDRDPRALMASIRNFGFVTVTGQGWPETWARARRARDVWAEIAGPAGIEVIHRNLALLIRDEAAIQVAEAFLRTEMGADCVLLAGSTLRQRLPMARADRVIAALWSPHELRVEPRLALPRLAAYLAGEYGVRFEWDRPVLGVSPGWVETATGPIAARHIVICPGADQRTLFADTLARHQVAPCKLQMLRVADPGWRLPAAVMNELSIARYRGYAELPAAAPFKARLSQTAAPELAEGIHLIVVQSADGSLVVGDSHHYGTEALSPFDRPAVDQLMLDQLSGTLNLPDPVVVERWHGVYPVRPGGDTLVEAPEPTIRLALVTSGTGMSTAFALAEEVLADWI